MKYKDWIIDFSGFEWKLMFLDIESENFGITSTDTKTIHIYTHGRDKQTILETLCHELHHMILFDLVDSIFHFDAEKLASKEENLVRLSSPRLFHFLKENKEFCRWLLKNI
jgi:hypothetical protein